MEQYKKNILLVIVVVLVAILIYMILNFEQSPTQENIKFTQEEIIQIQLQDVTAQADMWRAEQDEEYMSEKMEELSKQSDEWRANQDEEYMSQKMEEVRSSI